MNFDDVTAIQIPEGNVKSIAIGGVTVWEAPVVDKYTWDAVFASIDKGTYATEYAIGDMVPLDLGDEGLINMQIIAFDADDLADGSGKAPITWLSKEYIAYQEMNPAIVTNDDGTYQEGTGSIGGWEKTETRTYLKDTIKPLIPEVVRNYIKEVTKTHDAYNTAGSKFTQTSIEDVWLPDHKEMFDSDSLYKSMFPNDDSRKKYGVDGTGPLPWWLRSAAYAANFYFVKNNGQQDQWHSNNTKGITIGFCT